MWEKEGEDVITKQEGTQFEEGMVIKHHCCISYQNTHSLSKANVSPFLNQVMFVIDLGLSLQVYGMEFEAGRPTNEVTM